jgi:hypothetical protein
MKNSARKRWLLIGLGVVTHSLFFAAGYYISLEHSKRDVGERALGSFMQGLAALSYIENGNIDGARNTMRIALDGDLLTMSQFGTPVFDTYSASKNPGAKARLLLQYDDIRKKYPPIEYSDGGVMNREVDQILNSATAHMTK